MPRRQRRVDGVGRPKFDFHTGYQCGTKDAKCGCTPSHHVFYDNVNERPDGPDFAAFMRRFGGRFGGGGRFSGGGRFGGGGGGGVKRRRGPFD